MPRIAPENWQPVGVDTLEKNAWHALRSDRNLSVVAGPGAGKSEFLAQKATYLLQTGLCPDPYRILAISFKRDAAANLAERVKKRCPPGQSVRFSSLTFDAFTKSLIDRFQTALPDSWRPSSPYEIVFPKYRDYKDILNRAQLDALKEEWRRDIVAINKSSFEPRYVGAAKLPIEGFYPQDGRVFAIAKWWEENLKNGSTSNLSFIMLNRLAELLLRFRPDILAAIRKTYPYVFVDEFQDTTYAQYDFLKCLFHGSTTKITIVGDDKQRIMGWAGARGDAFQKFALDYNAEIIPLLYNFRSSPELVQIQHVIAKAMNEEVDQAISQAKKEIDGNVAQVWTFNDSKKEIVQIGQWIAEDMLVRGTKPRDYAIIVRQKPDDFENEIKEILLGNSLNIRNEARMVGGIALQDIVAEDVTEIFCAMLHVFVETRNPKSWKLLVDAYLTINAVDRENEVASRKHEKNLELFIKEKKEIIIDLDVDSEAAKRLAVDIFSFLEPEKLKRTYLHYGQGDILELILGAIVLYFIECSDDSETWTDCIDKFEGVHSIPLMTIHKSKGLEFDTVLFIGLDDSSWWSYSPENPEGMATFFVALSRAKQRAIFTYCSSRGRKQKISQLYDLLIQAGVPKLDY